jgi:hypothetical protein
VTVGNADMRSAEASPMPRLGLRARLRAVHEARGAARGALLDLAERLRAPRRVDPDGVRLARQLLHDGAGPLYVPAAPGDLSAAVLQALRALDAYGAGS